MRTKQGGMRLGVVAGLLLVIVASMGMIGCENGFFDPSKVGRFEPTPVTMPILSRLDVIDERSRNTLEITQVRSEDLIPDRREYVIGSGDVLWVTIFELVATMQESGQSRRVDETGMIRLPYIGAIRAAGRSPRQLEDHIVQVLEEQGLLRNAIVSVTLIEAHQNTFSVYGSPQTGGTAVGRYVIPKPEFYLMDALAMARGVPDRTRRLLVIRQIRLEADQQDELGQDGTETMRPAPTADEIEGALDGETGRQPAPDTQVNNQRVAPPGLDTALDVDEGMNWEYRDGQWVRVPGRAPQQQARPRVIDPQLGTLVTQRIIEVPLDRLLEGDMRYNIVIRPGDVIRVPSTDAGFVYVMGEINRPGAYVVPGENDLTLTALVASAGGLGALAIPERVDLTRRMSDNSQTTLRLNVRAIFAGEQPDIFMKPNDLVNFGTTFWATPLAIFRNGFRATYGFGFVLDRNFGPDVFD